MKNSVFLFLIGIFTLAILSSCDKEQVLFDSKEELSLEDTPQEIKDFVSEHFPQNQIRKVVKEVDDGQIDYEVLLENDGVSLEFNEAKVIEEMQSHIGLPQSVFMPDVYQYVQDNYPGLLMVSWELDATDQEVELNNKVELIFDLNGNFIRVGG